MGKFYRVCHIETKQGLWYSHEGEFTGYIHGQFSFCSNSGLAMDYDPDLIGYMSATDSIDKLFMWFTKEDISELQKYGYYIHEYEALDVKFYDKFSHYIINRESSIPIRTLELTNIPKTTGQKMADAFHGLAAKEHLKLEEE